MIIFDPRRCLQDGDAEIQSMYEEYFRHIDRLEGVLPFDLLNISRTFAFHDLLISKVTTSCRDQRLVLDIDPGFAYESGLEPRWIYDRVTDVSFVNSTEGSHLGVSALGRITHAEPHLIGEDEACHMILFERGLELCIKFGNPDGFRTRHFHYDPPRRTWGGPKRGQPPFPQ